MSAAHTPRFAEVFCSQCGLGFGPGDEGFSHCSDHSADALLRRAAPDLLKALTAIVKSLSDHDDEGMIEHAQQMIDARAAIAKATGVAA